MPSFPFFFAFIANYVKLLISYVENTMYGLKLMINCSNYIDLRW